MNVEYHTQGCAHYLGQYETALTDEDYPRDEYEAEYFALEHFFDKY